jgi:hypothetical protein
MPTAKFYRTMPMWGGLESALGFSQVPWSEAKASRRLKPGDGFYSWGRFPTCQNCLYGSRSWIISRQVGNLPHSFGQSF